MVPSALSRKTTHSSALITREVRVQREFERTNIVIATERVITQLGRLTVHLWLGRELLPPNERILIYMKS